MWRRYRWAARSPRRPVIVHAGDMALAEDTRVGLPPGPSDPQIVQAVRYTWRVPPRAPPWHARFGETFTLRLPGLEPAVITSDRELIRHMLTGDPHQRRHANDILAPALGTQSVMLLEPAPHLRRRRLLLPPFHGERI